MSNQNPLEGINQAFKTQMALKNDSERKYHVLASRYSVDIVETFQQIFPGIEIEKLVLREKSEKSLKDKICSLQIERLSKLAAVTADIPEVVHELEIKKYGSVQPINFEALYTLFANRMDENITPQDDLETSQEAATTLASYYKHCISQVLSNTVSTPAEADNLFDSVKDIFAEPRISSNTKKALARIMYSKIKSGILPDYYRDLKLQKLYRLYGSEAKEDALKHATSDTIKDAERLDYLKLDEILHIENDQYDLNETLYDNSHKSKLDRLIDEQEFLRARDLQGMQIVITNIPRNYSAKSKKLRDLINKRNLEQDAIEIFNKSFQDFTTLEKIYIAFLNSEHSGQKDKPNSEKVLDFSPNTKALLKQMIDSFHSSNMISDRDYTEALDELKKGLVFNRGKVTDFPSYIRLDQACMEEVSREFSNYMEKHSSKWLKDHNNSLLIRDSFKHKDKANSYVADHFKIAMEGDPSQPLEVKVLSIYVDALCGPGKSASHGARIGKQRVIPKLLDSPHFSTALLTPAVREAYMQTFPKKTNVFSEFMDEIDSYLPRYTILETDTNTKRIIPQDLNTIENAALFYDNLLIHDHTTAQRILNLIQVAESYGYTIPTSPKEFKKKIEVSNSDPDDPDL